MLGILEESRETLSSGTRNFAISGHDLCHLCFSLSCNLQRRLTIIKLAYHWHIVSLNWMPTLKIVSIQGLISKHRCNVNKEKFCHQNAKLQLDRRATVNASELFRHWLQCCLHWKNLLPIVSPNRGERIGLTTIHSRT